jgi:hypothetical protein
LAVGSIAWLGDAPRSMKRKLTPDLLPLHHHRSRTTELTLPPDPFVQGTSYGSVGFGPGICTGAKLLKKASAARRPSSTGRPRRSSRSPSACVGASTTELVKAREHHKVRGPWALVITAFNRPGWSAGARTCALVRTRSTDRSICTTTDPRLRRPTLALRGPQQQAQRRCCGSPAAPCSSKPLRGRFLSLP